MQPPVIVAHIEHTLKRLVIGEGPFNLERLVGRMFISPYKIAGQVLAISGIEIARHNCHFTPRRQHTRVSLPRGVQQSNIDPHPFAHRLVKDLPKVEEGFVVVAEAPGLVVEVNEEAVGE